MTPDELRSLADEATPGPWEHIHTEVATYGVDLVVTPHAEFGSLHIAKQMRQPDARLIALAPDLARLCAEYAGAFAQIEKLHHKDFDLAPQIARRALAKLAELKPAP